MKQAGHSNLRQKIEDAQRLHQSGELGPAAQLYRAILEIDPSPANPAAAASYDGLGLIALANGRPDHALLLIDHAIVHEPKSAIFLSHRGTALMNLLRHEDALAVYKSVLAMYKTAGNHDNLAVALRELRRYDEAVAEHEAALKLDPGYVTGYNNYAVTLLRMGQIDKALDFFARILARQPKLLEGWHNMADCLRQMGRPDLCIRACHETLRLNPRLDNTRMNEALCLLVMGQIKSGWQAYEIRKAVTPLFRESGLDPALCWQGETLGANESLLIQAEQGLGDTLQFARYIEGAKAKAAVIHLRAQEELLPLLKNSLTGIASFTTLDEPPPRHARHVFTLSLPPLLDPDIAFRPLAFPYLRPDSSVVERWRAQDGVGRFESSKGRRRVGFIWSGNPGHQNDRNRSATRTEILDLFARLPAELRDTLALFSFQKGTDGAALARDAAAAGIAVTDLAPDLADFAETAAALMTMDLLICVDTSIVHLAGALGREAWCYLPHSVDWRWGLGGEKTPWYPTVRLFREPGQNKRSEALARIHESLARWAQGQVPDLTVQAPDVDFPRMAASPYAAPVPEALLTLIEGLPA